MPRSVKISGLFYLITYTFVKVILFWVPRPDPFAGKVKKPFDNSIF